MTKCKFCGSEVNGKQLERGNMYCSDTCMKYQAQLNWLIGKKDDGKSKREVK